MQGARFGNYEVVSQLGEGGMGTVYVARHTLLGRTVAVKVLRPELSQNREIVNRFFNEARAATSIHHPGIIEIFDFGYDDSNSAYIIMELLQGESLGQRLHRVARVSLPQALTIVRQIAGALQAAHEQQILHRDLKPDNVFLVLDPEVAGGERIKLLDFGIAKLLAEPGEGGSHTVTGVIMGTPTYMSPEQCRGSGTALLDGRSDLYALGCIFYELLSGRPPFVTDGIGDLMAHHMYFPPPPLRTLVPDLPAPVESLVLRLLAKDPRERPPSAGAVVVELEALGPLRHVQSTAPLVAPARPLAPASPTTLNGSTGVLAGPSAAVEPSSGRRRRRWFLLAPAVMLAAIAVWLGVRAPVEPLAPPTSAPEALAPRNIAPEEKARAVPPPPTGPMPDATPAPAAPTPAATAASTVLLQFLIRPEGAPYELSMNGKKLSEPQVEVPMSRTQKVELQVVAKGYRPYRAKLLPTSDQILTIDLQRDPGRGTAPTPSRPSRRVDRVEDL